MNDQSQCAAAWGRLASRTARKVNLAWFAQSAGPALLIAGAAGFAGIVWWRSRFGTVPSFALIAGLVIALVGVLGAGFLVARGRFLSAADAMVRLESELRLHNALSAATARRAPWPQVPARVADGWQWHWPRVIAPLIGAAAFIALAWWLPLSPDAQALIARVEPQAWAQMDAWLDKLQEEKIVTPEEKEEQAARIRDLRAEPPEKWFSHESLNAGDTLKQQLQRDIQNLGRQFDQAARSLNALDSYADQLSPAAKDKLLKDFDEAVADLKTGALDIDPSLLKKLGQIDPKDLKSLSPGELKELRDALKKNSGSCKGMCENPGFLGDGEGEDDEMAGAMGLLKKPTPGDGGIDRGPGTAPLTLSDEENRFDTNKNEPASNPDLSRAQLGTVLGMKDGKHEVDKSPVSPSAAGAVQNTGDGGAQVWRESLTPAEKAVLKKAFK